MIFKDLQHRVAYEYGDYNFELVAKTHFLYRLFKDKMGTMDKGTEFLPQTIIFQTLFLGSGCCRPLIFQTMNSVRSNNPSLKYQKVSIINLQWYHSCMPSPLAPDPIRVQPCVWCLLLTNKNCIAVTSISLALSISSSN